MKRIFSIAIIPIIFIFFTFNVNYSKENGLTFKSSYNQSSASIISNYISSNEISTNRASYLKQFGESKFYQVWKSSLKESIDEINQENDYASVVSTLTSFYNLYKLLYPTSSKVDDIYSFISKNETAMNQVAEVLNNSKNLISQYSKYLKGSTVKINGKFKKDLQYLYASYSNDTYGYYLVTFTNTPNDEFTGTIILAIPDTIPVTTGGYLRSDVVLLDETENDSNDTEYTCGMVIDGNQYEKDLSEYESDMVYLYITLPQEIINYVKSM